MIIKQVTIGAGVTNLSAVPISCSQIIIQNNDATNNFRVGDQTVTTSIGLSILKGGGSVNIGPLPQGRSQDLSNIWVAGTQNGLVDIAYITA